MIQKTTIRDPDLLKVLTFAPLTKETWGQFEQLFGERGACDNCWCMAYPVIPAKGWLPEAFAWIGLFKTFEKVGFKVVDRTSVNRPMVRYYTTIK
jgi:hypothetical protein